MATREIRREDFARERTTKPDQGPVGELDSLRESGRELLAAGDEAIERALSKDNEAFLRSVRQRGGQ